MASNQPRDSKNVTLNVKALQLKEVLILWFAKSNQLNLNANHHMQIKGSTSSEGINLQVSFLCPGQAIPKKHLQW